MAKKYKSRFATPEELQGLQNTAPSEGLTPTGRALPIQEETYIQSVPEVQIPDLFPEGERSIYDQGITLDQATQPQGIAQYRHEKQPWYSSLGSSINQAVTGQLVGGSIEGVGYLLDIEQYANLAKGTEQEFGNWFSDLGKELRTWSEDATPIYTDPNKQGGWNPEDWTWWMSNLPSVASTLSLMIPSGAVVKGASALAKGLNLSSKVGQTAKWATKGITQAAVSRHMESMMESSELMPQLRDELNGKEIGQLEAEKISKNYGISLPVIGQDEEGNNLYQIDEQAATEIGAKAAADSYRANWAMMVQDIPQYLLLQTPFGKASQKLTVSMARKLGKDVAPVAFNQAKSIGLDMIGEAGEEAYQYIVGERAREMALAKAGLMEERNLSDAIKEYTQSGDLWTSATFGALGAGFMQTVGRKLMDSTNRLAGIESDRDARIRNVDSWGKDLQLFRGLKQAAEATGSQLLNEEADHVGLTSLGVKASQARNLEQLIEAIEQVPNMTEEEQQRLNMTAEDVEYARQKNPNLVSDLRRIGELFERNSRTYAPEFAGLITQEDFNKEFHQKQYDKLNDQYNEVLEDIPYISQLSSFGQDIVKNEQILLPAAESALEWLKQREKSGISSDAKEVTKSRINELEKFIKDTRQSTESLKAERSSEEATSDSKLDVDSPSLEQAKDLYKKRLFTRLQRKNSEDMSNKMRTFKWQDKARKQAKKVRSETAEKIVDRVQTPEEAEELKETAKGTDVESLINSKIKSKATDQLEQTGEEVVFESEFEEGIPLTITQDIKQQLADLGYNKSDISAMKPEEAQAIVKQNLTKQKPSGPSISDIRETAQKPSDFAKKRYSNKPHLWAEERDLLSDHLDKFLSANREELSAAENKLLNTFVPSSPERLDQWFTELSNSEGASKLQSSINEFYNNQKAKAEAARSQKDSKNNVNYTEPTVEPTQQEEVTEEEEVIFESEYTAEPEEIGATTSTTESKPIGTSEDYLNQSSNYNASNKKVFSFGGDYQKGGKSEGRNFIAVNTVPVVDKNGLNQGEYKPGTTLYFELDTKDKFSEKPVAERGIQIVVYKNGDPSVKTPANRKVVGLVPAAKGSFAELLPLREQLATDLEANKKPGRRYITSNYTSQISGYMTAFSRSEQRNSPLTVLREEDRSRTEYSKFGGYVIGITEKTNSGVHWSAPRSGMDAIQGVDTKHPGQIIIGTHNPLLGDTLLLRAFVRKLANYESENNTFASNGQKIRQNVIDILKEVNQSSSEETMVDVNNRIKQYLIGNISLERITGNLILDNYYTVPLTDIQNDNLQVVNEWLGTLIFNIDKNKINAKMAEPHDFGYGSVTGKYNELVNDFLVMNTTPGQYYNNTSVLVDQHLVNNSEQSEINNNISASVNDLTGNTEVKESISDSTTESVTEEQVQAVNQPTSKEAQVKPDKPKTLPKRKTPFSGAGRSSLMNQIRNNQNKPKTRLADSTIPYTKWDRQEELAWFKSNFPQVPITVLDNLKEIVGNGREAWGVFNNAAVYIAKNAATGTAYHEAFHVAYNLFLNESERSRVLRESKLNEEQLADEFADYIVSEQTNASLGKRVNEFFKKLWYAIRSLFNTNVKGTDELFYRINTGFYKNAVVDYGSFGANVLRTKIADWPSSYTKDIVESINNHILLDIIPEIKNSQPELANLSDVEVMSALSKEYGATVLWDTVYENLRGIAESGEVSDDVKDNIEEALLYFYDENGNPGSLIHESIRFFDTNNGIRIGLNSAKGVPETGREEESVAGEESSQAENWQSSYTERSRKTNTPYEVKKFLRYIPSDKPANAIGLNRYVEYETLYDTLLQDLADSTSLNMMKQYLEDASYFHPEYKHIIDKIKSDSQFGAKFFNAFHNTHAKYLMALQRGDNYVFTESNKKGVVNSIISRWRNSILADSKVLNNKGRGEYTINTDRAKELKQQFDAILKNSKLTQEHISEIVNITDELGFKIDPKVFQYAMDKGKLREVLNGEKSLSRIVDKFAEGKNPFDDAVGLDSEIASIRMLATVAKKATPSLYESSFRNISGKTVYSHLVPNYLTKLVANLKNPVTVDSVVDFYAQDPLLQSNPILVTMSNLASEPDQLQDAFEIGIVDGISETGNRVDYPNMTVADYQVLSLSGYFNNGNKKYSYYRGPVLSDAPNMVMSKFKRFKQDEAVSYLLELADAEYRRIKALQDYSGEGYNNYNADTNASTDTGYHIMPMFNGFNDSPKANPEKAKQVIREYLDTKSQEYKESLVENKVLTLDANDNIDYKNSRIDSRIASKGNIDNFLQEFYYNDFLMRASFGLLTVGDPAFYKGEKGTGNRMVDYIKRAKEIYSPKYIPDTSATYTDSETGEIIGVGEYYNTAYLQDEEIPAPSIEGIKEALNKSQSSGYITQDQKKSILAQYSQKKSVNMTDAQAYVTLPFYRKTMIGLGRWNDQLQDAYNRLEQGLGTANDIALVLQPVKPFMYTQIYDPSLKRLVPVQHKNSEYLLLPQLALATNEAGSYTNPKLAELYNKMNDLNIGVVNFESAVKTGLTKATTIDRLSSDNVLTMNMSDRGIQQEVPEHFRDSNNLFGSQIRKLIMADLVEGVDYVITGEGEQVISKKADELRKVYEDIILQDLIEGYESASSELTNEDGTVSWKKVYNILLDEARNRGKGEQYELAITYDAANDRLNLPLFHPLYANVSQQLLTSLFKSRVTKQKITGGSFVQATSYGISDELKLVFKEGALDYAEILLPAWSKEFYKDFVDSNGNVNFTELQEKAPELVDMIGYRIPTEDKYSMLPLKVVGFLPLESGGAVMLPAEITTISGSDFDVDKMYIMMKSFTRKDFKRKKFRNDLKEFAKDNEEFNDVDISKNNLDIVIDQIINQDQVLNEEDLPIYDYYVENKDKYDTQYEIDQYDLNKPWSEQSKGARDNAKIDIMLGVLKNPATLHNILTPGGFDYLKDLAQVFRSKTAKEGDRLDVYDITSNDTMAMRNMTGKQLTGIAANHNAHHALRQNANLNLNQGVMFDNNYQTSISQKKAVTQYEIGKNNSLVEVKNPNRLITKNFAEFLAAIVDNAKDPVAGDLGYTIDTADMMALIVATGYDIATAASFVNQPIVKEVRRIAKVDNVSEDAAIKEVANATNTDLKDDISNLSTQDMFKAVGSTDIGTDLQKQVLVAYNTYKGMAKSMGKLIQATQADTNPLGPTLADSEVMISSRNDVMDERFPISGIEDFISESEQSTNLESRFYNYGIEMPLRNIINKMFPYRNDFFDTIKETVRQDTKFGRLSAKQLNTINSHITTYMISGYNFFDITEAQDIIMKLPLRVFETIRNNPELSENALLKRLNYEASDKTNPVDRLTFDNTGSFTDTQREDTQNAWLDLLNSTNETYSKLGLDLIKYSYFTSGLSFGPSGFSQLVPTEAYLNIVKDSNGRSLSDYLYTKVDNISYYGPEVNGFMDQFYRNMASNMSFVPRVKADLSNVSNRISKGAQIVKFTVDPDTVKSDDFVIRENNEKRAVPYISHEQDGKVNLYQFKGVVDGNFEYELVSRLGIHNQVLEYNINMEVPQTLFSENEIKNYTTTGAEVSSVDTYREESTPEAPQGNNMDSFLTQNGLTKGDIDNLNGCVK